MAQIRTIDFLPEIFKTSGNDKFLRATLDQMVQQPDLKRTQGYIGQPWGPGVTIDDSYVVEPTETRQEYQLEPAVIFTDGSSPQARDLLTYPGYLDALKSQNGTDANPPALFREQFYSWAPFIDFDKVVNYTQYYWLPDGPPVIDLVRDGTTFDMSGIIGQEDFNTQDIFEPNNVQFTNGLRVRFSGNIYPAGYQNKIYVVEGVGQAIVLVPWSDLALEGAAYSPEYLVTEVRQRITTEEPAALPFVVSDEFDDYFRPAPEDTVAEIDYITINRASLDLNPWTRRNRWFHIDVINKTAEILETSIDLNDKYRGARPIVEFQPSLRLFDFGTDGIPNIDLLCFGITDAFDQVAGQRRFIYDGIGFHNGMRVIFPDDINLAVRSKVWLVEIIDPNSNAFGNRVVNLIDTGDIVSRDSCCVSLSGDTQRGKSFWFDGTQWMQGQTKTRFNQAPLFDLYDVNGVSYADPYVYPASNFQGNSLFGYKIGSGRADPVLGFPLVYRNYGSAGEIVFDFYLYTGSFTYELNSVPTVEETKNGFVRQYQSQTEFAVRLGYETIIFPSIPYQIFNILDYTSETTADITLDVAVDTTQIATAVKITVNNDYQDSSLYNVTVDLRTRTTKITPLVSWPEHSIVNIQVLSDDVSQTAYYQIPKNLEVNALNQDVRDITLSGIRNHFVSGCRNNPRFRGNPSASNNTRDIYNIAEYCTEVVQHSAPATFSALFLRNQELDLFNSLDFNSREYEKFKQILAQTVITNEFLNLTTSQILDQVLELLSSGRSSSGPFYWTDMLPSGLYQSINITYQAGQSTSYDLSRSYDFTRANYRGLLIYRTPAGTVNETQLIIGRDYQVQADRAVVEITTTLQPGDVISIREYSQTWGSYVPATPTKLGLHPRFLPEIYTDTTYINPTEVIRGHDGSITPAFGDIRDTVLLEFESRIYNNIKVTEDVPFLPADIIPGKFRSTEYTQQQVRQILDFNFLAWVGLNKIDYQTQSYYAASKFTWNYRRGLSVLGDSRLPGFWRGIYRYFYDTTEPHLRPWEMLGFSQAPQWWVSTYGPAPYTRGNRILWDDVRDGIIREPGNVHADVRYARPEINSIIPVDDEGQLLDPEQALIRTIEPLSTKNNWIVGDGGPAETAWINSSTYPFVLQKLYALLKPSQYFTYCVDRDLYKYDASLDQWVYRSRGKLKNTDVEIYDGAKGIIKNSYVNFVVEYNKISGLDISGDIEEYLRNIDIRLAYRAAGYTDKRYLRLISDRSTPGSNNRSLLIPDESYSILLYENEIVEQLTYSSVNILKTDQGFQISGNGLVRPYFRVFKPRGAGSPQLVNILGNEYQFPQAFDQDNVTVVPYGENFRFAQEVVDFLCGYGAYLENRGVVYEESENNVLLDWPQMAYEFVIWARQNWGTGSLLQLNPSAEKFLFTRENLVAGNLLTASFEDRLIDQNRQPLAPSDYSVNRIDNTIELTSLNEKNLGYFNLRLTNYEHVIVFDNNTIFADVIYDASTGLRQNRLLFQGVKTSGWNGTLNAPGFFIYQQNVSEWDNNLRYNKGDVVYWKGSYYQATETVYPSADFIYSRWSKIGRFIENGTLLPNLATKAQQSSKFYDQYYLNLNTDSSLLGYGLTGFRPRAYMESIDLDLVSQINVYNDFIRSKGTADSIKYFTGARIDNNRLDYVIYENWAVQRAVFGSTTTNAAFDVVLDINRVYSNPSTIQLVGANTVSSADQVVSLDQIYDSTFAIQDANVLPLLADINPSVPLPTAGYVNTSDVDYRVFDITSISELDSYLTDIKDNTLIWVAQNQDREWAVYKCQQVNGTVLAVQDNLSGQSRVTFNAPHGLGINEYIFIRFFDTKVDGIYQVRAVLTAKTILIDLTIGDGNNSTIIGNGIALVMRSVRLSVPKDMVGLTRRIDLVDGNKIWVDNDHGSWQVLEKQQPWTRSESYNLGVPTGADLGASVAISGDAAWSLVGSPGYQTTLGLTFGNLDIGGVYLARNTLYSGAFLIPNLVFIRDTSQIRPRAVAARAFGSTLVIADQTWAAVSAPGTVDTLNPSAVNNQGLVCIYRYDGTNLQQYQLLIEPGLGSSASGTWGQSLVFSQDENTLIVSDGNTDVRVYRRISYQIQRETYIVEAGGAIFYSEKIKINRPYQLDMRIDGVSLSAGSFVVDTNNGLVIVPYNNRQQTVELTRRLEVFYQNIGPEITDIEDYLLVDVRFDSSGQCINPGILRLIVSGGSIGILRSGIDYVIHPSDVFHPKGVWISITDPSLYGSSAYVRTGDYFQEVSRISRPLAQGFGRSLAVDATAAKLAVGNTRAQLSGASTVDGAVEIYSRGQLRYEITSPMDAAGWEAGRTIYDPADSLFARILINGELEYAQTANNFSSGNYYYTYDSATSTANIRFDPNYLQVGDIIVFDSGYYGNTQQPSQILTNPVDSSKNNAVSNLSQFGSAVAMSAAGDILLVGAPYDQRALSFAGSFSHFTDTGPQWGRVSTGDLTAGANIRAGDNFTINGYVVTFSAAANTAALVAQGINLSFPANITIAAQTQANVVTIYIKDSASRSPLDQLRVSPTQLIANTAQDAYRKLNFQPLGQAQLNFSAVSVPDARFGSKIVIDQRANIALIYSQYGSARLNTTFDRRTTTFDADSTEFDTGIAESGSVDLYQLFAGTGIDDLPAYAQIQQVVDSSIQSGDAWGSSIAIDRAGTRALIGSSQAGQSGRFAPFIGWQSAFKEIRRQPVVADTRAFNSVSLYNKTTKIDLAWLDFFDPLQGRILGAAQQNIDYIGFNDPAQYNVNGVNNRGIAWTEEYVGSIWWDVTNVRFIDYHQGDIEESARLWGTLFPGSQVDIYQWVSSPVAPSVYPGPGTPYSYNSYVIFNGVDDTNKVVTKFYFWVRGITTVSTSKDKTLSPATIAQYIENPRSSGIPYIAAINPSTLAIYNCNNYLLPDNTVLHVDYDRFPQDQSVFVEYDLIKEEDDLSFLDDSTYRKMVDSYAGIDSVGLPVPDPRLGDGARYGVNFRPRQTMFRDRLAALKNYITYVNSILINYDITYIRTLYYWNLQEEYPAENSTDPQGQPWWNVQVQNLVELNYQNFYIVPLGYRYLVLQDATNRNGWSIYQVTSTDGITRSTELLRRQSYRTSDYWRYVDYYAPGFDSSLRPKFTVDYYGDLSSLSGVAVGDLARVNSDTGVGYQIYQWQVVDSVPGWNRVAAENGTVQVDISLYDYALLAANSSDPLLETRNIIQGINQDIFTGDLSIFKNRSLALTFRYIVAEQVDVNWLYKTSLIDVRHPIGSLSQSATYKRDNQEFVLDYVQEAKPYHAYLKDFSLVYTSTLELTNLDISDFDLPAAFDPRQQTFISPILDPNSRFSQPRPAPNSSFFANANVWQESSYSSWYGNYGISVSGINILDSGVDFTEAPVITIQSPLLDVIRAPKFAATINAQGSITGISVLNSGLFRANVSNTSYSNTLGQAYANVIITSVDGRGGNARAYLQWTAEPVRQFNTLIKYDRVNLRPSFGPWQANSLYFTGDLVKFGPKVWQRNDYESLTYEGREFDFTRWSSVSAGNSLLDGVDRTYGFSTEDPSVAITGLTYPGVRLRRGFLGTFDTSPFSTDPFESDFGSLDTLLSGGSFDDFIPRPGGGANAAAVAVVGGAFVDTYSSHSPEELVPGATFDTLDLITRTAVGEDSSWQFTSTSTSLGWSTQVNSIKYVVAGAGRTFRFADALHHISQIVVNQVTQGRRLIRGIDYSVDWINQQITLEPGRANSDDVIGIDCYAVGGGYQLLRQEFVANVSTGNSFVIDVPTDNANYLYDPRASLSNVVVLDNGNILAANFAATNTAPYDNRSNITLPANIAAGNLVSVVAIGFSYPTIPALGGGVFTYSLPDTAVILGNGSNSYAVDSYRRYPGDNSPAVTVVEKNYLRLRGAASVSHVVRGNTRVFEIPYQTDVLSQGLDQWANRVNVWVNGSNTYLTTDNVGLPVYLPWTYSANYSARGDILEVILDQDPGPANSNVRVTVSITANIVDYVVSNTANRIDFTAAVGNSNTLQITSWNDTRQEYLDNRVFVGKNYDIVENSPNNVVTCGRWDNDSNTIALGFVTEGIWLGNTVANVTVSGNVLANITINGIPYSFDNFDLLPWNLANVLIVNGIETNEPGYIPIQSGYDIYADGLPTGIKVSAPRRSNTANNVPYFIDSVTEFINFQGRTQYAVLLDRPAETLGIGWTFNDSTVDNSTISLKGITAANVSGTGNVWVAVGDRGTIVRSENGSTWATVLSYITFDAAAIVVSPTANALATEPDAGGNSNVIVTNSSNTSIGDLSAVAANTSYFVTVGEAGNIWYSNTGAIWEKAVSGTDANLRCVSWTEDSMSPISPLYWTDEQGNLLIVTEEPGNALIGVGFYSIGNRWIAGGEQGKFLISFDANVWYNTNPLPDTTDTINAVLYDTNIDFRNRYLAFTEKGYIYYSDSEGSRWGQVANVGVPINGALQVGNSYFAVGDNGLILRNSISGNSLIWDNIAGVRQEVRLGDGSTRSFSTSQVRVNEASGVQVTVSGTRLRTGIDFSVDSMDPVSITIGGRGLSPAQYANTVPPPGPGAPVIITGFPLDLYSLTYDSTENRLMTTGANGLVLTSTDLGNTWYQKLPFVSCNLHSTYHASNLFVAVGEHVAAPGLYQRANLPPSTQAAIISSPRGDDVRIEFVPEISKVTVGQLVEGDYIRRQSLITSVDYVNRSITVDNPLHSNLIGPRFNSVIRIYTIEKNQRYDLGESITNGDRLWVSVDGRRCFENYSDGFIVDGSVIEITANVRDDFANVSNSSVVQILTSSENSVRNELDTRIWKDMRDNTATYRQTPNNTTTLSANLGINDDEIFLSDVSRIQQPAANTFGMLLVGTERIAYRQVNSQGNTVSGLLRGLAGTSQLGNLLNYDTANANSTSYSGGSNNILRLAHTVGQSVVDVSAVNTVPLQFRDRFNAYTSTAIAGNIDLVSRGSNVANVRVVYSSSAAGIPLLQQGDIISIQTGDTSFNERSAIILETSGLEKDFIKDLTFQYIQYSNPGGNSASNLVGGNVAKTDYFNTNLFLLSNAQVMVSVAGTPLANPQAYFDLTGANVRELYVANTADIPGQTPLFVFSNSEVLVTVNGAEIVPSSSYTISNTNPLILEFAANTLPVDAQIIITAQTEFQALALDPVRVILKQEPKNNQLITVAADYSQSWYLSNGRGLQYQGTAAGRFFRDEV